MIQALLMLLTLARADSPELLALGPLPASLDPVLLADALRLRGAELGETQASSWIVEVDSRSLEGAELLTVTLRRAEGGPPLERQLLVSGLSPENLSRALALLILDAVRSAPPLPAPEVLAAQPVLPPDPAPVSSPVQPSPVRAPRYLMGQLALNTSGGGVRQLGTVLGLQGQAGPLRMESALVLNLVMPQSKAEVNPVDSPEGAALGDTLGLRLGLGLGVDRPNVSLAAGLRGELAYGEPRVFNSTQQSRAREQLSPALGLWGSVSGQGPLAPVASLALRQPVLGAYYNPIGARVPLSPSAELGLGMRVRW